MDLIRLKSIFPEMILNADVFRDDQALSKDNSGEVTVIGSSSCTMKNSKQSALDLNPHFKVIS